MGVTARRRGEVEAARAKHARMEGFIQTLAKQGGMVTEFEAELWYSIVENVQVSKEQCAVFTFKDGTECAVAKAAWKA